MHKLCFIGLVRICFCRVAWVCRWYDACDHLYTARFEPQELGEASKCPHHSFDPLWIEPLYKTIQNDYDVLIAFSSSHDPVAVRLVSRDSTSTLPKGLASRVPYTTQQSHSRREFRGCLTRAMALIQRPLVIQSNIIRLCCPRTSRRSNNALFARGSVHHHQLHTKSVTDNDISRLASLPLHPLTLADLVK